MVNKTHKRPLSPLQVKRQLWSRGTNLKAWAVENGYSYHLVSNVMRGVNRLTYGKGRDIAIKLGMLIPDEHDETCMREAA